MRLVPSRSVMPLVVLLVVAALGPAPAAAAGSVELGTPYPAVAVAPGSKVSFDLRVRTDVADRVDLSVAEVPADWIASLRGEGFVVDGVQTTGSEPVELTLDVTVPEGATAGTEQVVVVARSGAARDTLPIDIRVEATAAGQVSMTSDFPELQGAADQAFTFSLRLANDTAEDLTFNLQATGPAGWDVEARPSGQAQAASATVNAGGTSTINVTANAPEGIEAGSYPIGVTAVSADRTVEATLTAEVIGDFSLEVTTPNSVVSTHGNAGSTIDQPVTIQNTGTAALEAVTLAGTAPSGWTVTFDPPTVNVPANDATDVVAHIVPSADAIAGDYVVTVKGSNDLASGEVDLRVTVETSLVWGLLGIALIVLVVLGLGWVFRRYGRR
jgi:uncharacterized membrane protein